VKAVVKHYESIKIIGHKKALKPHLGWHAARLSFLSLFLLALLKVKTLKLKELAFGMALIDFI